MKRKPNIYNKYRKWKYYNDGSTSLSDIHSEMLDDILERQYQEQQLMMYKEMGEDTADYIQAVVNGIKVKNNQIVFDVQEVKKKTYSMQLAALFARELVKSHIKMLQDMFTNTERKKKKDK